MLTMLDIHMIFLFVSCNSEILRTTVCWQQDNKNCQNILVKDQTLDTSHDEKHSAVPL